MHQKFLFIAQKIQIYADLSINMFAAMSNSQVVLPETEAFDTRCIIAFMLEPV